MTKESYECALTGVLETPVDMNMSDGLADLPVGWTKVTMTRRAYNPKWLMIQQVKSAMTQGLMAQFEGNIPDLQRVAIQLQVESQFLPLERETPMFMSDIEEEVYISDSSDIVDTVNEVRSILGLEPLERAEEGDETAQPALTDAPSDAKAE